MMSTNSQSVSNPTLSERQRWLLAGLPLTRTRYVLREDSLSQYTGLLSPMEKTVSLSQIRNIQVQQSRLQALFGLTTIHIATDDPLISELVLLNIRNGALFEERLRRCTVSTIPTAD